MPGSIFRPLTQSLTTLSSIARDLVHLLVLVSRSRRALAAENLFLRKQLALFQERKVKPHRADDSTRLMMVILGRLFAWRDALVNVRPDTFVRWHRKGFRLLWRLQELLAPLERPVIQEGKRSRALRPFDDQDRLLLEAIIRGEFVINGFRNKDLQKLLYLTTAQSVKESRRRSGAMSRKLRLLRDHGLIQKIQKSYRYKVTSKGRSILTALIAASHATVNTFIPKAA